MRLDLTDDQRAIQEVFGAFFERESPPSVARAAEPLGFDAGLWTRLADLGAPAMGLPEAAGGGGASLADLAVVAELVGRAIAPVPFVDHVVVGRLLAAVGALADDVVDGGAVATFVVRPARAGADVWTVVPSGAVASVVVGMVGDDLVCVRGDAPGTGPLNLGAMPVVDRPTAGGTVLASGADAHRAFTRARAEWQALTAAALTGLSLTAQQIALVYVNAREQFDRPIGSFQAIQHQLADVAMATTSAALLVGKAAWAGDRAEPGVVDVDLCDVTDFEALASMAFLYASEASAMVTDRCLHAHGGYGFAEEYDIQLFFRRARGWALVAGDPAVECLRLSDRLFEPVGG